MATTTWPTTTADDVSSGRGAKTSGLSLYQRDRVVEQAGMTVKVSGNTGSTSYATVDTFTLTFPTFAVSARVLRLFVYLTDSGGTSYFIIQDNATSTDGADSASVSAGSDWVESILTIGASWTGERLINVRAKASAGTATVASLSCGMNCRWGD